ncbi:MAG: T9SS type A sorting domain-containing protein, partial [Chitinophagales bacterium]|nr:T9SS type A sorting domain-containing protein [Chitinophagales bacterium]
FDVPYFGMDWPTDSVGYGNGLTDLYKTIDQGETWFKLPNPFGEDEYRYIYGVPYFLNKDTGLVVAGRHPIDDPGADEILGILRTENGGMSWFLTDTPEDALGSNNIVCWNTDTCYYTYFSSIYRTTNGGGFGEPLSVTGQQHLSLTLHPNPATDQLFVEGLASYPDAVWSTYSISGQTIPLDLRNGQADISHLPPGIYLTTVQTPQGIWRE